MNDYYGTPPEDLYPHLYREEPEDDRCRTCGDRGYIASSVHASGCDGVVCGGDCELTGDEEPCPDCAEYQARLRAAKPAAYLNPDNDETEVPF